MPAAFEGEPLEIGFNPEFLKEGIESVEGDEVMLRLISPLRPGPAAAGRQRRLPLPGDADPPQRLRRGGRCSSPPSKRGRCAASTDVRVELGPGIVSLVGPNGAGKTNLARGALLRPHRPLLPHLRPPRPDPLRRAARPRRGDGPRRGRHRAPAARLGQPRRGPPPPARRQPRRPRDARPPPPARSPSSRPIA